MKLKKLCNLAFFPAWWKCICEGAGYRVEEQYPFMTPQALSIWVLRLVLPQMDA